MKLFTVKFWPLILLLIAVVFFFNPFVFGGKLPTPADTIVGLYHPFRDFYAQDYPNSIPFKNFLITDPVRQQYPWRDLSITQIKNGELPLWNPYSLAGTPLLANFQSAIFYPLNIFFFLLPFNLSWSILIFLQPLLAGIFLYLYLRNLNLSKIASFFGGLTFSFSGFFIAWLEWGTILHSALWLPMILLSIDKIVLSSKYQAVSIKNSNTLLWSIPFLLSLTSSFFAGHLQTFFYLFSVSVLYFFTRWIQIGRKRTVLCLYLILNTLFLILTSIQWWPTWQFINLSGRELDQINWQVEGWFIPWQNLIQFVAPDFFGNPATLNYWGVWNYAEFVGYVGVLPLILAFYALIWRQDKKVLFFGTIFFLSLLFAFPTLLAKLPYQLQISFLSTSQPTRLLFLTDFSLAILAALGLDHLFKSISMVQFVDTKRVIKGVGGVLAVLFLMFGGLWIFVLKGQAWLTGISAENLIVAKRNLILPTGLFTAFVILLSSLFFLVKNKKFNIKMIQIILIGGLVGLSAFDLLRFGQKFTPFIKEEWLFPKTEVIEFLQKQERPFRIMATDRRIFPPNFSVVYRLESIEGYDPLYLARYGELIAASERGEPNISPPFGFNRIITPQNFESRITDLLNVKYVLSLDDLNSKKLKKVFQEGQTKVYENLEVFPRAFLVHDVRVANNKQEAISFLFDGKIDLKKIAVTEETIKFNKPEKPGNDEMKIVEYKEQKIVVETKSDQEDILVLSQNFYPGWQATVDGRDAKTYRVDFNLLGIVVPAGEHRVEAYLSL